MELCVCLTNDKSGGVFGKPVWKTVTFLILFVTTVTFKGAVGDLENVNVSLLTLKAYDPTLLQKNSNVFNLYANYQQFTPLGLFVLLYLQQSAP